MQAQTHIHTHTHAKAHTHTQLINQKKNNGNILLKYESKQIGNHSINQSGTNFLLK